MMRKKYKEPSTTILTMSEQRVIMSSKFTETETDVLPYNTNDPQAPGNAMSRMRGSNIWEDDN